MSATRDDPLRAYNFVITLIDTSSVLTALVGLVGAVYQAGFSECTGLETGMDVEEYREGGNNGTVLRFPTRVTWTNLHLKRGIATSDDLWTWHAGFVDGTVRRRDGMIVLQDDTRAPIKVWRLKRALPVRWTGPAFNAMQSQVAIEELELAHEGLQLVSLGPLGGALGGLT